MPVTLCDYDVVNIIREHPDEFPAWHSSPVAELYTPPVFEHKKVRRLLVLENKCVPLQKIFIIIGFMTALHALMS